MKELNPQKVALTFGLLIGGGHVLWSILIVLGLAQPLLNFIFWAHMLTVPSQVTEFTLMQAGTLIVVTFAVGYSVGFIFASVWNKMHR